jgi:hypothetical protein
MEATEWLGGDHQTYGHPSRPCAVVSAVALSKRGGDPKATGRYRHLKARNHDDVMIQGECA